MHDRTNRSPVLVRPPTPGLVSIQAGSRRHDQASPGNPSPAPWATTEQDPDRAIDELSSQFSRTTIWFGEYTGSYWALTSENGTYRLLEGTTPDALRRQLLSLCCAARHRPHSPGRPLQPPASAPLSQPTASARRPFQRRSNGRGRHCLTRTPDRGGRC
jgi:hypothetical protein